MTTDKITITKGHRNLLLIATVMTYLLITLGGTVCITNSGQGCPDWPKCYGEFIPPLRLDAIIEYTHRFIAMLTTPLIITAAIVGWWKVRGIRWVSWPPVIAVGFTFAVIVFGAFAVLTGLSPGVAAIDLGSALLVLALMVTATVVAFSRYRNPALPDQLSFQNPFTKLAVWTLVGVFVVLVSGVLVAESGSMVRCVGWPIYSGRMGPVDFGWPQVARHIITAVTTILIIVVVVQAWRMQRNEPAILRIATAIGSVFLVEIIIGFLLPAGDFTIVLLIAYVAMAAALWALLVALVIQAGLVPLEDGKT